jgi:hypothetical protein
MPQNREKYTRPKLREQIKDDLKRSGKGGKPGRWSARKSQMLVQEYEQQGGGYTTDSKDEAAKSLERWTDQDWQTIEGSADAREGGTTRRYLPKKVWEALTDAEKREAERTKTTQDMKGKRKVPWTPAIKRAFARLEREGGASGSNGKAKSKSNGSAADSSSKRELYEEAGRLNISGRSRMTKDELRKAISEAR